MNGATESFISNVLPIALAIALISLTIMFLARRPRRRLLDLAEIMDPSTTQISGLFSPMLRGRFRGRAARLWFLMGSQHRRPEFHIALECRHALSFHARAKGLGSAIRNLLRFGERVQLGVVYLDEQHVFASPEPERLVSWVSRSEEARGAMDLLLRARGVGLLALSNGSVHARIEGYTKEQVSSWSVRAALESLEQLAQSAESA
jgi:hypothetical protein